MFKNFQIFNTKQNTVFFLNTNKTLVFFLKTPCFSVYSLQVLDVSYTGKTYKWGIKRRFWKLVFNRVHPNILFFKKKTCLKKIAKTKFRVLLNSLTSKQDLCSLLYNTRRYNIFTHRGMKIKGFVFLKKRGKVSTYR